MPSSKTLVYCTGDEDRRSSLDYHEGKIPQTTEIHKTIAYSNHEAVIASLRREPSTNPLEAENHPLTTSSPTQPYPCRSNSRVASPAPSSHFSPLPRTNVSAALPSPSNYRHNPDDPEPQTKDLSFLLHPSFYLPISQLEAPPQLRTLLQPVSFSTPMAQLLADVETLLSRGDFISAAHIAAGGLTSPALDPTDVKTIAHLLSIRYSCLELTGNTFIAAQESKALEDLNSEFYYFTSPLTASRQQHQGTRRSPPSHILPFSLRLQASRLQAIGFSDPRRGVSALYDLGLECREHIASPDTSSSDLGIWKQRLAELGIWVVNTLIQINDIECAKRTMRDLQSPNDIDWKVRMGLLLIKVGDVPAAKRLFEDSSEPSAFMAPILATAEGRFEDAIHGWEDLVTQNQGTYHGSIAQHNLALNYLYVGRLEDARHLMEALVDKGENYASLIFNLATIYELSSEKSRELKMSLVEKVASQNGTISRHHGRTNADFKL